VLKQAEFAPSSFARGLCNTVVPQRGQPHRFIYSIQRSKIDLKPAVLISCSIYRSNKRQIRAELPPIITQETLLEEEDEGIERILQNRVSTPGSNGLKISKATKQAIRAATEWYGQIQIISYLILSDMD
jgi:predicted alternative tryptophan synthase beta-subunit